MMAEILGTFLLPQAWKRMPDAPPSKYSPFRKHRDRHHAFSLREMEENLRRGAPCCYPTEFPEET